MNILIVDDIHDNLDMLEIVLRSVDYQVTRAINGKDALEKLHLAPYDLIISDILMPVMDGFQLCKACKQDKNLQSIPFVFYTATYVDKKDEDLALSIGASRFLLKPQEPEAILQMVRSVMEDDEPAILPSDDKDVPEAEVYKLYSERLVNKLEKKMHDLEKEIEHRKMVELELIVAKERAEQSDHLKSAFLANISHEIRTPLNGIIGFASLLREMNTEPLQVKRFVDIIIRSGNRLTSIIGDIIEISKLESGQTSMHEEAVDVIELLNSVYDEMSITIPDSKQLSLVKEFQHVPALVVTRTDRTKLAQVLTNLISNAIKYTLSGSITIGFSIPDDHTLQFSVRDTGIGIDPAHHDLIFERFRQVEELAAVFQSGTGLGLAISKSYVEMLGGRIWVESEKDQGAAFTFILPYRKVEKPELHDTITSPVFDCDLTGKTILVVEDDQESYTFIEQSLLACGARLVWAKDGRASVGVIRDNPDVDLVLMDLRLPVMSGFDATSEMLKIRRDLPVIAQTAYAYTDDKKEALKCGCAEVITKPFTVDVLLNTVCRFIR